MRLILACPLLFFLAQPATAAAPPPQGPAPLLHVRFNGPPGVEVTFYQGQARPREYRVPVEVGLRPGYIYRIKVSGFVDRPGLEIFPTLEVRGTVRLGPLTRASKHPCPVYLSPLDVERLLDGSLITKVLYLEDPRKAPAETFGKEQPLEVEVPPDRDLLNESRNFGRPVLVMRLGNRDHTDEELQKCSIPNTILFPGSGDLGWPRFPPQLKFATFQWYDPILGPKKPEEECLRDGGDQGEPVGFGRDGQLYGLDPEDTVAEYRDSEGIHKLAVSNRVCICVPRFAVLRTIFRLDLNRLALGPGDLRKLEGQVLIEAMKGPNLHHQLEQPAATIGRERPSQAEALMTTLVVGRIEGTRAIRGELRVHDLSAVCREEPRTADKPLKLEKWSDKCDAEIGDVVSFTLKYSNCGGRPITDVVVSDSLTARLEYVPGSAQSSRNAVFTTQPNESGSLILRWQINGTLLPGQSGVVRFQARVR